MSVETSMYNNQIDPSFQPAHLRSGSFNELLNSFKQSVSSEQTRLRSRKRSYNDLIRTDSDASIEPIDNVANKRSKTAPPQSPSPVSAKTVEVIDVFDKNTIKRPRSLSPSKKTRSPTPSSPTLHTRKSSNKVTKPQVEKTKKSNVTLPSFSTVLRENVENLKPITPTTSLDYFDTYKPNDENWRYGLLDTMTKNKTYNMNHYTVSNNHARPVFDSKISKPILPPISFEPERKINFPYESNYTYLNQTYLYDVEKYPEYLELAESLVQLSNSSTMPYHRVSKPAHFPPLYPHQVVEPTSPKDNEEAAFERQQREQRAYEQQHYHQQYLPPYQSSYPPYPAFMASPSATVVNILPPSAYPTYIPEQPVTPPKKHTKFIPITPPSSKSTKSKAEPLKSPTKNHPPRVCISCGSDQSPCWRPSWSSKEGQLCNSCGLRYKKTSARCLNNSCKKIPAKGEWSLMQTKGVTTFDDGSEGYGCLECGNKVEVKK